MTATLDPFGASLLFKAIKLHFTTPGYDYNKYQGKVSGDTIANKQKFLHNKQRFFFAKLARYKDPLHLLVSNFLHDPKVYITNIVNEQGLQHYEAYVARRASRYYNLTQELKQIDSIKELLTIDSLPPIIERYISGEITPETVIMIDAVTNILDKIDLQSHPLVEKHLLKLQKYRTFVDINKNKIKQVFESRFNR